MDKDKVVELLEKLGTALTVKGEQAFAIMVGGARAEGYASLIVLSVFLLLGLGAAACACWFFRTAKHCEPKNYADNVPELWLVGGAVSTVVAAFIVPCILAWAYWTVLYLTAPEYIALTKLAGLAGLK